MCILLLPSKLSKVFLFSLRDLDLSLLERDLILLESFVSTIAFILRLVLKSKNPKASTDSTRIRTYHTVA